MMHRSAFFLALFLASLPTFAQDLLHYKFDSGGGNAEINFGVADPSVPRLAPILRSPIAPPVGAFGPGKFGTGLGVGLIPQAGFELDTGWDGVVGPNRNLTIAFFLRNAHPIPTNGFAPFFRPVGNGDGVALYLSSIPGSVGHLQLDWQGALGNHSYAQLPVDVLTPSLTGWVHVAVTVTRSGTPGCYSAVVRWYVNGVPQPPQSPSGCWHDIFGSSLATFRVGKRDNSFFRLDEFRLGLRAASASEIADWASRNPAVDAPFGESCAPFGTLALLASAGGRPVLGNPNYSLNVYGLPGTTVFLALGLSDFQAGALPLPFDLAPLIPSLAGCFQRTSADLAILTGQIAPDGRLPFPLPIPSSPVFSGLSIYSQALLFSPTLGTPLLTNAFGSCLGL